MIIGSNRVVFLAFLISVLLILSVLLLKPLAGLAKNSKQIDFQ